MADLDRPAASRAPIPSALEFTVNVLDHLASRLATSLDSYRWITRCGLCFCAFGLAANMLVLVSVFLACALLPAAVLLQLIIQIVATAALWTKDLMAMRPPRWPPPNYMTVLNPLVAPTPPTLHEGPSEALEANRSAAEGLVKIHGKHLVSYLEAASGTGCLPGAAPAGCDADGAEWRRVNPGIEMLTLRVLQTPPSQALQRGMDAPNVPIKAVDTDASAEVHARSNSEALGCAGDLWNEHEPGPPAPTPSPAPGGLTGLLCCSIAAPAEAPSSGTSCSRQVSDGACRPGRVAPSATALQGNTSHRFTPCPEAPARAASRRDSEPPRLSASQEGSRADTPGCLHCPHRVVHGSARDPRIERPSSAPPGNGLVGEARGGDALAAVTMRWAPALPVVKMDPEMRCSQPGQMPMHAQQAMVAPGTCSSRGSVHKCSHWSAAGIHSRYTAEPALAATAGGKWGSNPLQGRGRVSLDEHPAILYNRRVEAWPRTRLGVCSFMQVTDGRSMGSSEQGRHNPQPVAWAVRKPHVCRWMHPGTPVEAVLDSAPLARRGCPSGVQLPSATAKGWHHAAMKFPTAVGRPKVQASAQHEAGFLTISAGCGHARDAGISAVQRPGPRSAGVCTSRRLTAGNRCQVGGACDAGGGHKTCKEREDRALELGGCAVCQEVMHPEEYLCVLPCGHLFHYSCAFQWALRSPTCPTCRVRIGQEV